MRRRTRGCRAGNGCMPGGMVGWRVARRGRCTGGQRVPPPPCQPLASRGRAEAAVRGFARRPAAGAAASEHAVIAQHTHLGGLYRQRLRRWDERRGAGRGRGAAGERSNGQAQRSDCVGQLAALLRGAEERRGRAGSERNRSWLVGRWFVWFGVGALFPSCLGGCVAGPGARRAGGPGDLAGIQRRLVRMHTLTG